MKISLENSFPGMTNSVEITKEMCDLNGHMNVLYYNQILSFGIDEFYSIEMGFTDQYFKSGYSTFTLEDNYRYLKECLLGEKVTPRYRLHKVNKKLMHIVAILVNESDEMCALYETVLGHIDMNSRKTSEMNETFLKNLIVLMDNNSKYKIDLDLRLKIKDLK
jgi:acyl-CoA thioester hydrolase